MKFTSDNNFSTNGEKTNGTIVPPKSTVLTSREKEVLRLVAEGHTAQEIATILFLSMDTVETHRRNIIRKMRGKNIVNAVVKAMRKGLLN
ncbi:MAG: LuxR C-terminal-related transcriptional regulator [Chitinophagales bacterium]|nr:LuxR C-terminal-related transcriptional regulator [Chitinophagales bacterium]